MYTEETEGMWTNVLSVFDLLLWNKLDQLEPLVRMFIGWSLNKLMFFCWSEVYKKKIQKYKNKRPTDVKKDVVRF
jgi:hypothetical protein